MTSPHLTDDEVADYLSGVPAKTTAAHLAQCVACRDEMDRLRGSLRAFDQASLAWSEARTGFSSKSGFKPRPARRWHRLAAGTIAGATVLAVMLFFTVHHRPPRLTADGNVRASNLSDSTAEIERDNLLMRSIDEELDSLELSPSKMYGISSSGDDPYPRRPGRLRSTP